MSEISRNHFIENVFPFLAPGTALRDGIDNVLRAGTGGSLSLDIPTV